MKVVILGAGLSGMCATERLCEKADVTVLEKAPFVGGLAASFKTEGEWIPMFYHHIIASNKYTLAALHRFNCMKGAVWKRVKVVIGIEGKSYNIQNFKNRTTASLITNA